LTSGRDSPYVTSFPNSTGSTNSMAAPNKRAGQPALDRALAAFEVLQQRLMAVHAAEFTMLDITMAQAKLLYVLTAVGELSMSEIARRLGVTVSTASGAVDRLVELGLLARSDDPNNRRQVRVSVTALGMQTLEQIRELSTRQLRMLFEHVDDEDLEIITRAIHIMADAVAASVASAASTDAPGSKK
jgi:DNA-binding MarR family transcriptional regulator